MGQQGRPGRVAYYVNYLVDNSRGVIVDVEATAARYSAEALAARLMIERHDLAPPAAQRERARVAARDAVRREALALAGAPEFTRAVAYGAPWARKKVEARFAELKRYVRLRRLRLRGLPRAAEQFLLAATAQNLKRPAADARP